MKFTVKDTLTPSVARIQKQLEQVPRKAFDFWVKTTPKRSGAARRRTSLKGNTIQANYDYAVHLDSGSSAQAAQGMSAPTLSFVDKLINKIVRK